jgi:uncharacterized phage protein gp47/JayE
MTDFGVTPDGFVTKGLDAILAESTARSRQLFGDVDLSSTSALTKILQVVADQDALLWRSLEDTYYSRFLSTAVGDDLDRLGEDIGVPRPYLFASGEVTFTVTSPQQGRTYTLPEGTVVLGGGFTFHTTASVTVSATSPNVTVGVRAFDPGPAGNLPANGITGVDPVFQKLYLAITPPTTLTVVNARAFTGGEQQQADEPYRARLLGQPRNIWTLDSVRNAVLDVPGVLDVELSDPLGGADVAQSYFGIFSFAQRLFSAQRRIGEPYFFDILVAHEFARPWRTTGSVEGVFERVSAAVDRVRPVGIHPNVVEADHIRVGLRARMLIQPGLDAPALVAAFKRRLAGEIGGLKLGGDVLYSQVMRAITEQPGVVDVQDLHLRRFPPEFARITFGQVPFQTSVVEAGPGENLAMGPREIPLFEQDSELVDLRVVTA